MMIPCEAKYHTNMITTVPSKMLSVFIIINIWQSFHFGMNPNE